MFGYRILEQKTDDGEPFGVWHICRRGDDGWEDFAERDFESSAAAVRYAEDQGIAIEE